MKNASGDPVERKESKSLAPIFLSLTIGGMIVVVVGMMIGWNLYNRKWVQHTHKTDVQFTQVPKTIRSGQLSRFVVKVEQDKADKPLPGRVMSIHVVPQAKAKIISVSGAQGDHHPILASSGSGQTDSLGNVSILVQASDTGKFTLIATDSTSNREGTVNFQVSQAEAE